MDDALPRCYRHPDRETGLECSSCSRPICPDCMTATPVGQRCPECRGVQKVIRPRAAGGNMMPVTGAIIVVNIAAYLLGGSGNAGFDRWGFWYGYLLGGDHSGFYRMVTSMFIHASLIHIGFNMYFLYMIGPSLETRLGPGRYLLLYLSAGLCGATGVVLLQHPVLAGGASGAIFGLMGALAVVVYRSGSRDFSQVGTMIAINLGMGFVISNVAWSAHIGGLVGGALVMEVYLRLEQRKLPLAAAYGAAVAIAAVGVVITYTMAQHWGISG
jgi:membrane associated rhomboid family serine protease